MTTQPDIPDDVRAHILARLDEVERAEGVRILFAAESGSRAWGFPSPDSDYDVRFVYAHPVSWYLSLREERDVIERPLDNIDVDLAGWDIRKALRLLLKSNAALYEWCRSPILYRDDGRARGVLENLFEQQAGPQAMAYHYRETARTNWQRGLEGRDAVRLKRYFYVARPLLALEWVIAKGTPPPMQIGDLLAAHPIAGDAGGQLHDLLSRKRSTPEIGDGPRLPALDAWIAPRLTAKPDVRPDEGEGTSAGRAAAEAVFRDLIGFASDK